MPFSTKQYKKINTSVNKVIHTSGNMVKGPVIDMVLVIDCSLDIDYINEQSSSVLSSIRSLGAPFLNMRLNLVKWTESDSFEKYVSSYPNILMGMTVAEKDIRTATVRTYDQLLRYLQKNFKKTQLVIALLKDFYDFADPDTLREEIEPLLLKKIVAITPDGNCKAAQKLPEPVVEVPVEELQPEAPETDVSKDSIPEASEADVSENPIPEASVADVSEDSIPEASEADDN